MNVAEPKGQSSSVSAGAYPTPDAIDLSCRLTLGVIFLSAAVWAVVAALFGLIASIKFHSPNFLADPAWLTYGRVRSASATAWIYGFFVPGGVGVALWIFARLGRTLLKARLLALSGTILWGIGVLIGFAGILRGDSSGFPNLEIPAYAATVLFIGYVTMAVSAALTFHSREPGPLFVSHWFLFTALFWFAWILSTAAVLLLLFPVRGMTQAVIDWWFSQNLRIVWFDLTGLGLLFYFIPKVYGRELHSRQLALLAYWTLILFAPWGGIPGSAPVPAWMPALAQVADAFCVLVLISVALNLFPTLKTTQPAGQNGALRSWFKFSFLVFLASGLLRIGGELFDLTGMLQFTSFVSATRFLHDYGFLGLTLIGGINFIVARLFARGSARAPTLQLWLASAGVVIVTVPLLVYGGLQAVQLANPAVPFATIIQSSLMFLRVSTIGDLCIVGAQTLLLLKLVSMMVRFYRAQAVSAFDAFTAERQAAEVRR